MYIYVCILMFLYFCIHMCADTYLFIYDYKYTSMKHICIYVLYPNNNKGYYAGKKNVVGRSEIHRTVLTDEDLHRNFPTYLERAPMVYGELENIAMESFPELVQPVLFTNISVIKPLQDLQNKLRDQYPTKYKLEKKLMLVFKGRDFNETNECSLEDFRHCMNLLNISLSEAELRSMCSHFQLDDHTGFISYLLFISAICQEDKDVESKYNNF